MLDPLCLFELDGFAGSVAAAQVLVLTMHTCPEVHTRVAGGDEKPSCRQVFLGPGALLSYRVK